MGALRARKPKKRTQCVRRERGCERGGGVTVSPTRTRCAADVQVGAEAQRM